MKSSVLSKTLSWPTTKIDPYTFFRKGSQLDQREYTALPSSTSITISQFGYLDIYVMSAGNIPESFPFSKLQASTLTFLEQKHSPQRLKNEALGVCFTSASVSLQDMCKEESRNEERIGLGSFLYIHTEMLLQTPQDLYVRLIGSLCEHLFL